MSDMITRSIMVKADVHSAYQAWENFENFPFFMKYIKSVRMTGPQTSHWVMEGPLGKDIEWDAKTTTQELDRRIGWSTKDDDQGDITTSGQVTFADLKDGQTQVTVQMQYIPKGGAAGEVIAKLFAKPDDRLEQDLRNFKAYIEGMHERAGR